MRTWHQSTRMAVSDMWFPHWDRAENTELRRWRDPRCTRERRNDMARWVGTLPATASAVECSVVRGAVLSFPHDQPTHPPPFDRIRSRRSPAGRPALDAVRYARAYRLRRDRRLRPRPRAREPRRSAHARHRRGPRTAERDISG